MTPLEVALGYIQRGWNPVPIPPRMKRPLDDEWQLRRIDAAAAPNYFNGAPQNIGVQLGPASGGLTDVDLDCPEAVAIAPYLLPKTGAIFGRASKRASHQLYLTDLSSTLDSAAVQLKDPKTKGMLLELRIGGGDKGAQTIFPGSIHECGEPIAWEELGDPARAEGTVLTKRARLIAACCLMARYWPQAGVGARHNAALVLGGFLSRAGVGITQIKLAAEAVARAIEDPEWKDRRKAAEDAAAAHQADKKTYGLKALRDTFGKEIADRIAEWLDYSSSDEVPSSDEGTVAAEEPIEPAWDVGDDPGKIPPREWLEHGQFCRQFMSMLVATGGTGKTALRYIQAVELAREAAHTVTGFRKYGRYKVLLLGLEDSRDEMNRRLAAVLLHHGITRTEVKGHLFCWTPRGVKLARLAKNGSPQRGRLEALLREKIKELGIDLVQLDPLIKTHSVGENNNDAMDFVCDLLARIAIDMNIAVDATHHAKKGAVIAGDADSGRGASAARDAGRLCYTLTSMTGEEANAFGVEELQRRRYVRLDSAKVNIVPPADKATWFKLVGVRLGNETEMYPEGDEVQTLEPWQPPKTWAGLATATLNAVLTEIDAGLPNGQRYSDAPKAADRAAWAVVSRHCPGKTEPQCREIIRTWVKNGVLYKKDYEDPIKRENRPGLYLDGTKRPQ